MATTTSVPWIALGFSLLSTCLAIGVPAYVYFFDKSAAGVMAEDKLKKANGAFVVEKQQEIANDLLNPANLLGGIKSSDDLKNTIGSQKDLLNTSVDNATYAIGIPGLTPEEKKQRIQKTKAADINYYEGLKNASTKAQNSFGNNVKKFVPDQTKIIPGYDYVLNTPPPNRIGGGRKTKNNRQKTVQPKIKKPRTKKCLITKGDKMFMSFCI